MDVGSWQSGTVVVVARTESNHPRKTPPSSPPTPSFYVRLWPGTKVDGGGDRTAPAYRGTTPPPFPNFQVRWNNKMPRITYSKSMAPYLGRTKGWVGSRYPVHPPTTRARERGKKGMITDDFAADILSNHTLICNCCPCFQFAFKIRFSSRLFPRNN